MRMMSSISGAAGSTGAAGAFPPGDPASPLAGGVVFPPQADRRARIIASVRISARLFLMLIPSFVFL